MQKKSSIKEVYKNIYQDFPALYKKLEKLLGEENPFAKYSIGAGGHVWSDSRCDWHSMEDADEMGKGLIRDVLLRKKKEISDVLGEKTTEVLFTTPDDSYIYYNDDGGSMKILITGWGFKKPVRPHVREDKFPIANKNPIQISFSYDGERLRNYEFGIKLANQVKKRSTDGEGLYKFPDVKVGLHYIITDIQTGRDYNLDIVEDKSEYNYDVTQYATLFLSALEDDAPVVNEQIRVDYYGKTYDVKTDASGKAQISLPYHQDSQISANLREQQKSSGWSSDQECRMEFVFASEQQIPDPNPDVEPQPSYDDNAFEPYVHVIREDGTVIAYHDIIIEYNGEQTSHSSDLDGNIMLPKMEVGRTFTVYDGDDRSVFQYYQLDKEHTEYIFTIPEEEEEEVEEVKKYKFMFRDLDGNPIKCDNVTFNQKDKNSFTLQLDENGDAYFDHGTFAINEPMEVSINGWKSEQGYEPVPFTLEEDEDNYLIQEKPEENSGSWLDYLWQALAVLLVMVAAVIAWPYLEGFFADMFNSIYN